MGRYYGDMVFSEPYKDKATGQEKKSYHKFGKVFISDNNNMSIYVPLLGKWFSIYKSEPKQQQSQQSFTGNNQYSEMNPPPPQDELDF